MLHPYHRYLLERYGMRLVESLLLLLFLGLGFWGMLMEYRDELISTEEPWRLVSHMLRDIGPELVSIALTVATIDTLNERRLKQQRRVRLVAGLSDRNPEISASALRELRHYGRYPPLSSWLTDGTLNRQFFDMVNLENADLSDAKLREADFDFGNLREANLRRADLKRCIFQRLDLEGADFSGAKMKRAHFAECTSLRRTVFTEAYMVEVSFFKLALEQARFIEANLKRASFDYVNLEGASFEHADLEKAWFWNVNLEDANLFGANLRGARIVGVDLYSSVSSVNLKGANLAGTNLYGVRSLTNIQLSETASLRGAIMPDGTKIRGKDSELLERMENGIDSSVLASQGITLEEWLELQKQLPPEERAIKFEERNEE